ncbi:MAG: Fe-Mn family superoxide dismutase [Candidatus Endonucleobacter bathymodioli]|uniref:Superoxide dismutase n=1 Tax=Candidatus Endonucleibacter bathymodioli TaxID=539814 RepID=A0AA90P3A5_9GAMM|nr:Fe-Mn family superoxide dismutase [Candidatus Endonucleobacter bathymodioli]
MSIELPILPYPREALEPHISKETLDYHYGKHHNTYVVKLNGLIEGSELKNKSLEEIIKTSEGSIFNNAAQVWNHTFYWHCLSPNGGGEPTGSLATAINTAFGSFDSFSNKFTDMAVNNFGSAWTWLVKNDDHSVEIVNTSNAATPLTTNQKPLLACDVWEHAYYIDYRNVRPDYLKAFWKLANWEFASKNYSS